MRKCLWRIRCCSRRLCGQTRFHLNFISMKKECMDWLSVMNSLPTGRSGWLPTTRAGWILQSAGYEENRRPRRGDHRGGNGGIREGAAGISTRRENHQAAGQQKTSSILFVYGVIHAFSYINL